MNRPAGYVSLTLPPILPSYPIFRSGGNPVIFLGGEGGGCWRDVGAYVVVVVVVLEGERGGKGRR